MTSGHQRVPDFFTWSAYSNLKHSHNRIEYQIAPDADMCPNINEHIAFAGRCEDPKILKQDGKLDEENHEAVNNS